MGIFAGVCIAFVTLVSTLESQWRAARVQHALQLLQALRTDREYLAAAQKLKRAVGDLDDKISPEHLCALLAPTTIESASCDSCGQSISTHFDPDFATAVDFVLNQYDFLAAGARERAIDLRLLQLTIRGSILRLGYAFQEYIRYERNKEGCEKTWENFVWLYNRLAPRGSKYRGIKLGPPC